MSNDDSKIASDWLRKLYEEAWKQYSHEDNLAQSRTNFYATVHAALFALLAAVIRRLYDVGGATIFSYHVHLGLVFVGVVMIGVASLSLCLLHNWKDVMVAGRQYLDLRLATVLAIEALAQIPDEIGL